MGKIVPIALLFLAVTLFCGCAAKKMTVVLAPDPDGTVGVISVSNEAGSVTIDRAYDGTTVSGEKDRPAAPEALGKDAVEKAFSGALSIQPQRPVHFLLYFREGTELTADSQRLIPEILAAISERKSVEIWAIGHTDTVGSREYNVELSRRRALAVRDLLVQRGASGNDIRTTSHGKENPLVPTGDNVFEPRNRRVEVVIQ